jgi:glyceraldehyde-3-phosphate dehydrogenase/erythrose-4-phosphate dehydrogenase
MHGCWKRLCPDLVQDFELFEETPADVTKEVVHLMNELNLAVSIEDVGELIASYSALMSIEDLTDIQEEKETSLDAKDDCQSSN